MNTNDLADITVTVIVKKEEINPETSVLPFNLLPELPLLPARRFGITDMWNIRNQRRNTSIYKNRL